MSTETSFDPSERELCDDGACLGVVVGGKCNACGIAWMSGPPRDPGSGGQPKSPKDPGAADEDSGTSGQPDSGDKPGAPRDPGSGGQRIGAPRDPGSGGGPGAMAASDSDFDPDRELCADGACTGLLDSDGKCKECGRSAAS